MLKSFAMMLLILAQYSVTWLAGILLLFAGLLGYLQVSYQPVMTTGDWIFVMVTGAGFSFNVGMWIHQMRGQTKLNEKYDKMREEWLEYRGEIKGIAIGRKEVMNEVRQLLGEREDRGR